MKIDRVYEHTHKYARLVRVVSGLQAASAQHYLLRILLFVAVEVALLASFAASRLILISSSCSPVKASGRGLDLNKEHKKTTARTPNTMTTAWTMPDSAISYVAPPLPAVRRSPCIIPITCAFVQLSPKQKPQSKQEPRLSGIATTNYTTTTNRLSASSRPYSRTDSPACQSYDVGGSSVFVDVFEVCQ